MQKAGLSLYPFIAVLFLLFLSISAEAQQIPTPVPGTPTTLQNAPQRDTSNKTNTSNWKDERTRISYKRLYSQRNFHPDTSLHTFHRRTFANAWLRNLGNHGSPLLNMFFTPEYRVGPTLGYHSFDVYRFNPDSLKFYNTTRPYSSFTYQLGSKAEQTAELLHTQNIQPNWNFAVQYRKITSPGHYKVQRTNHDLGNLTTNYESKDQHYQLYGAFVYNKLQNDENGGIISDTFLTSETFDDRRTIPVRFQNDGFSTRRSAVTTMLRDFSFLIMHGYTLGRTDTLYSEDSTQYTYKLTPRFRISHRFQATSEKYQYKDILPDSLRYLRFFNRRFSTGDSIISEQKWYYVDNSLMLNGFLGPVEKQLLFSAGIGNRFDRFRTFYGTGQENEEIISNYLTGELKKEALEPGQWSYNANTKFFVTGNAAGNFLLRAHIGKDISRKVGEVEIGFEQRLNNAPYNYTVYRHQYFRAEMSYNKESVTQLYGTVNNDFLKLSAGIKNYLVTNFIYINQAEEFSQHADPFNITQVWLQKIFTLGIWVLDNEVAYQQKAGDAPVNVPAVMGRHQLSIETYLFGNALKVATGIDVRWHTAYDPAGYSPFFNRFYYQQGYTVSNAPETVLFFNFKIKNFRAYLMGDQLQQFFTRNVITAPGYSAQDAMIRFGFNWVMVN